MLKKFSVLAVLCAALLVSGCMGPKKVDTFQTMDVRFEWNGNAGSFTSSPNPEIFVSNVPAGTAFFEVKMVDLDRPNTNHGGGTIPYTGEGVIPVGSLDSYRGPQPPAPEVHTYVITVRALNADKSLLLGEGKASRKYPGMK